MREESATAGPPIAIEDTDPGAPHGARLLRAMEDEVERTYHDREGSIHAISASVSELSPPGGAFVVVRAGEEVIGCGGLKRLDHETGEIKRMYLEPHWRGRGLSAVLLEALEDRARRLGYRRVRLDTGDRQIAARRLYRSAGYREIPDYNGNPLARLWFERELRKDRPVEARTALSGPPGEMTIRRRARPGDADAIVALHAQLYPAEHGVDDSFVSDVAATLDSVIARGWPGPGEGIWIVERDGAVAGCLALTEEGAREGRVRFFLLAPELRGRGLGRRLLGELLDCAREAGYERLTLATFSDLRAAAHLYREAGFELVREDSGPKWGREAFVYQHYELDL